MALNYRETRSMDIKKAKTEAIKLANLTGVNHVIARTGNGFNVYTENEYPIGYVELISPEIKIESIILETEPIKKKVNVSKKA